MALSRVDILFVTSLVFRMILDLPSTAGRIVMSVSVLSSCSALNSPLLMLLASLFAFLMHLGHLSSETLRPEEECAKHSKASH